MSNLNEEKARSILEGDAYAVWVQEGQIDFPVVLGERPNSADPTKMAAVVSVLTDFSGGSGDGFIQLKPLDTERTRKSVWWSEDEPVRFEFRASVRAKGIQEAWTRSRSFVEQALDRLSYLGGAPARLMSYGMLYNEDHLEECRRGTRTSVHCSTGGTFTRSTQPMHNAHVLMNFHRLSERAKRALRWFRKASLYVNAEDRFTGFYIALEAISDDVKEPSERTHRCQKCGESTGLKKSHTEGIKELLKRHPELPSNTFKFMSQTRAKLLHGSGKAPSPETLSSLVDVIQRLAAEGIAVSLKADPDSVRFASAAEPGMIVLAEFAYNVSDYPHTRWGASVREVIGKAGSGSRPPE